MQAAIADQVSGTYNLAGNLHAAFRAHTQNMADAVGTEMHARSGTFLAAVQHGANNDGQLLGRLKALATYFHGHGACADAGGTIVERADFLQRFNLVFAQRQVTLPAQGMNANLVANFHFSMVKEMVVELVNTNTHQAASFIAYRTAIADAWRPLLQLREQVIASGGAATSIYLTIHFFHQNLLSFNDLRPANVMSLDRARRSAPANSVFRGFPQWGVGNAPDGTSATNLKNHFLKHVLDADPLGHALDWKAELTRWWTELGISLPRRDARLWLGVDGFPTVEALFSAGSSVSGDNTPLPLNQVETFLETLRSSNRMTVRFKDEMYRSYGTPYRDRALTAGRVMTDKMVHATQGDANQVFVSGADGDIFVIARFEGPVLGISSCYFAQDRAAKLAARVQIWPLN